MVKEPRAFPWRSGPMLGLRFQSAHDQELNRTGRSGRQRPIGQGGPAAARVFRVPLPLGRGRRSPAFCERQATGEHLIEDQPAEYRSPRASTSSRRWIRSGGMYEGVPMQCSRRVSRRQRVFGQRPKAGDQAEIDQLEGLGLRIRWPGFTSRCSSPAA